ncbi:MAG: prephenate dehydrogenase/arogenate dehydrogenase family protein [Chitinispirillaceae bacterium]|nr:prephenate dehydrogenase/arogenate dehydrogenase family protein [Chitinispirillaceae bacterium]
MPFDPKTVLIYSIGLLGGSIGLGLKNSGYKGRIIGLSSANKLPLALNLGCIDEGYTYDRLADMVKEADLLILCSPVYAIIKTLRELQTLDLPHNLVIIDIGSTKQQIMECARGLASHVCFIGGHPMAGSEKSGPQASDPYLFQNAVFVLTPQAQTHAAPSEHDRDIALFFERYLGCRTLFLDAGTHDRIVAAVSHVPHLLSVALVNAAQEVEQAVPGTLALAAGGFRDMTRIAGSPYSLWHDILATNREAINDFLDLVIRHLDNIKHRLQNGSLAECFESSIKTRLAIPANAKGFIQQLSEVLVVVKDQPGMIARIATVLADRNINVKDIEVLKVREGEGGTIRLAFDGHDVAKNAAEMLCRAGFAARERT